MEKESVSLCALPVGERAAVTAVSGAGGLRQRLLELGLVPGTDIACVGESPGGGMRAYRVRGTVLALRDRESAAVLTDAPPPRPALRVALAGNPNVGKSTLFNGLTGLRQHTGNWSGKTVALAAGRCRGARREILLTDLPGCYSLSARSEEERVARDYLRSGAADAVIAVCDACSLERGLILALQIAALCPRTLLCVNLMDEAARRGLRLDLPLLEKRLGLPVVGVTAHEKSSRRRLLAVLEALAEGEAPHPAAAAESDGPEALYRRAEALCEGVCIPKRADDSRDRRIDRAVTGKLLAWPLMLALLSLVIWLSIAGANLPSQWLSAALFSLEGRLDALLAALGAPGWLRGLLCEGAFRVTAWVVSVMLPPMAIFFPLFALLEEAGFLPRVAYSLDRPFAACRACGKQGLCMLMGLGCNAAGVTGCRIIDGRRERLLAVLTNALVPCNGRFPALIALCSLFLAGRGGSLVTALWVAGLLGLSLGMSLAVTALLGRTLLRGEAAPFVLELPPYRLPRVGRVLLGTLREKTLRVLGRAVAVAAPAGALLWLLAKGGWLSPLAAAIDPAGRFLGLDGATVLAFILGLPANEIVLPVGMMIYRAGESLAESASAAALGELLRARGWTAWTAGAAALFMLFHWPCSTTLLTVKKEAGGWRWAALAALIPTLCGIACCLLLRLIHAMVS